MIKTRKESDVYSAHTPKDEVEICEHCPYPLPRCKTNGCAYFKEKKAALLEEKRRARELRKKGLKCKTDPKPIQNRSETAP